MIAKIKYMAVHSDNYQGGSGQSYISEEYFHVMPQTTIEELLKLQVSDKLRFGWPIENVKILSIEINKVKKMWDL